LVERLAKAILKPLTKEEEDAVHVESLRILSEVGIKVTSERVFSMLAENGAVADVRTQVVRISEDMVKDALGRAPKEFVMCARDKAHDLPVPAPSQPYGVNDGQPTYVWDIDTQRKRKSTIRDLIEFTVLCDAMSEVDLYWPEVAATDLPPGVSNNHEFVAGIFHTGKHIQHGGDDTDVRFQIAAAAKIVGSYEELAKRPIVSITHTPITPLRFEAGDVDAVVEMAKAGLPVVHLSMAISGSVAPVTLVGTVALVNAENLAGAVISQLARPGAPILYSSESGPMDMRSGVFLSGSTEGSLVNAAGCQMALRYRLPSQVGGIAASGCVPGFEVGYQKAISALIPAMAGADQVVGIGGFERSGCESLEQIVMDCELWRNIVRAWSGIEVNEQTLAFDAISRVGPGGYFMKDPHTLRHFRREVLQPKVALLPQPPGSHEEPMALAARAEVKRILAEHQPVELDKSIKQEIKDLLAKIDREVYRQSVPFDHFELR